MREIYWLEVHQRIATAFADWVGLRETPATATRLPARNSTLEGILPIRRQLSLVSDDAGSFFMCLTQRHAQSARSELNRRACFDRYRTAIVARSETPAMEIWIGTSSPGGVEAGICTFN